MWRSKQLLVLRVYSQFKKELVTAPFTVRTIGSYTVYCKFRMWRSKQLLVHTLAFKKELVTLPFTFRTDWLVHGYHAAFIFRKHESKIPIVFSTCCAVQGKVHGWQEEK